ncbi:DUF4336 domain-containing protein [Synechococcus elongatus]|uniref:DUF4336 domain-containing protein n=1 Tax=Synechococcus elongatus (strain ATCC 33912 / PCC 7942 / FACHB-805) TaxID=1140 RepID=Q31SB3_SYNE7|nr:DUF4336 domain-containing protein [Synechococcus elongatus]ABB56056.1 conserved hypothetical protein [Synechococcus elongatus PCC 7942 = FACHB-805]MBD2587889.1 DUF4336 domain-containing protein [Synechococcus elongatus FACHB-242]MBD2688957.1 DUF4336 domain-containing protein [Synechococcus elongatus FACHB-1061]MBD2707403.1 DUF4336 domain-containing protein [Synechococcus elongatus PCC 7942 = FACHB-805]UOW69805.1 protein of unknown function DUF4336 [Synechococcus elongatus PCC 7943]
MITSHTADQNWPLWPLLPLYPYGQRQTLCREILPSQLWVFEQLQGVLYVAVPIRMTVVRLQRGGLLVYAPIAPTRECRRQLQALENRYGAVQHIVLPTSSGLEHKVFVGPFARAFPSATIWVAPDQWSFPLRLPLHWLGIPRDRTRFLADAQGELVEEFEWARLGPIDLGPGPFEEIALFHRPSRSLLLTDTLIAIQPEPPAIAQIDPWPLLFHSRDRVDQTWKDTPALRRQGWQRTVLFSLYFRPSALEVTSLWQSVKEAGQAPERSRRAYWGLYPFHWKADWQQSFQKLPAAGTPFVAPILQELILSQAPKATLAWVDHICQWPFEQIVPCHFEAPIAAGPDAVRQAFAFLRDRTQPFPEADLELLHNLDRQLQQRGITPPRSQESEIKTGSQR